MELVVRQAMHTDRSDARVDERDTMFARMARREGTAQYVEYYARRPELRRMDDRLRKLPQLCRPGGIRYDPRLSTEADRYFEAIPNLSIDEDEVHEYATRLRESKDQTSTLKEIVLKLGAVAAGCTRLGTAFVYTHKGRFDEDYGTEVTLDHPGIILFLVEMDYNVMRCAPGAAAIRESARQYFRAARISKTVVAILEFLGFSSKSHHDAQYDVVLPPLARLAGLGEIGRNNILITDHYGSRVRIGAVSTDMPLRYDQPVDLGAEHFCELCRKCAENCPPRALSSGDRSSIRGTWKWPTNVERCYAFWRTIGTDCGICMAVCPFSHRNNLFHAAMRWIVKRARWTHRMMLFFDDLVYGQRWKGDVSLHEAQTVIGQSAGGR